MRVIKQKRWWHVLKKLNQKTAICSVCHQNILSQVSLETILYRKKICQGCGKGLRIYTGDSQYTTIYYYNDIFKNLLYRYKGQYEKELAIIFLDPFKTYLKKRYRDYIIVCAPSCEHDIHLRGFDHLKGIISCLGLPIADVLYKIDEYKQTTSHDRTQVSQHIKIRGASQIIGKKVLLFDDVITSGETIKACCNLLEKSDVKAVSVLILSKQ